MVTESLLKGMIRNSGAGYRHLEIVSLTFTSKALDALMSWYLLPKAKVASRVLETVQKISRLIPLSVKGGNLSKELLMRFYLKTTKSLVMSVKLNSKR